MASSESMAIRCDNALAEIEDILSEMKAEELEALPRTHRDREMLRVIQLEAIATWLRELALAPMSQEDIKTAFEQRLMDNPSPLNPKPAIHKRNPRRKRAS